MMPQSECEFDRRADLVDEPFFERNKRWQDYNYVGDSDYVPKALRSFYDNNNTKVRNKPSQPDGAVEEDVVTANNSPDVLVPNWLAWVVLIGMIVAVLAVAGWAVHPTSIFLWLTAVGVAVVTVGLFYGQHYLNERNY
jgi:hypothetical protein